MNECGPGRYSSAGSAACKDCQPGEKCIKTTQEKPLDCPIGTGCRGYPLLLNLDFFNSSFNLEKDTPVETQLTRFYVRKVLLQIY